MCDVAIKLNNFGISERLQFLQNVMVFRDNSCTLSCCGKGIIAAVGFIEKLLKITATIATLKSDMKNVEKSQIMSNSSEHTMQKVLVTVQSVYKMPLKEDLDMYSYCSLMNDYVDKLKLSEV